MEIFLDCLPCVLKQVLEASRLSTEDTAKQTAIIADALDILSDYQHYSCSPHLVQVMHQVVKRHTGIQDPYQNIKARDIREAKIVYPALEALLKSRENSLYWALKISATGNIIDSALFKDVDIQGSLKTELEKPFAICDLAVFEEKLKTARKVLIIGDNAGETVFDRVLVNWLSEKDVVYAVRSQPIINDATLVEAQASGLDQYGHTTLVSTGCSAPGAVLDQCSEAFMTVFEQADLVISKGQGNYEALAGCSRPVFFLLKAKCPMIAERLNITLYDYVFQYAKGSTDQIN